MTTNIISLIEAERAKMAERNGDKVILDVCCGGRHFWFDKHHPNAIYIDNEPRAKGVISVRPEFECKPDMVMDFTKMDFPDKTFKLVVFDPPHMVTLGKTSVMRKQFGCLNAITWQADLRKGFNECWRVLQDYGVLVFKWNECEIKLDKVLELFHTQPLFGHSTGSKLKTKWLCFMKIPKENEALSSFDRILAAVREEKEKHG